MFGVIDGWVLPLLGRTKEHFPYGFSRLLNRGFYRLGKKIVAIICPGF